MYGVSSCRPEETAVVRSFIVFAIRLRRCAGPWLDVAEKRIRKGTLSVRSARLHPGVVVFAGGGGGRQRPKIYDRIVSSTAG